MRENPARVATCTGAPRAMSIVERLNLAENEIQSLRKVDGESYSVLQDQINMIQSRLSEIEAVLGITTGRRL